MKSQILLVKPSFKGIAINDAVPLNTIITLGVTMAWTLNPKNAAFKHGKILVAGNNKVCHPCYRPIYGKDCHGNHDRINQKGEYFIANILRVERCEDIMVKTSGMGDVNFRNHHNFIKFPVIPDPVTGKYWHENSKRPRYAVYFDNTKKITINNFSSTGFTFPRNPIIYIP